MGETRSEIRIWPTIVNFVRDEHVSNDAYVRSLREDVAEFLVAEVMAATGDAELGYSYTGLQVEGSYPDAYWFDDDGRQLRVVVLVGQLGTGVVPLLEPSVLRGSVNTILARITSLITSQDTGGPDGLEEGVGEFCFLLRARHPRLVEIHVKAVVLGSLNGDLDEASEMFNPRLEGSGYGPFEVSVDVVDIPHLQDRLDEGGASGTVTLDVEEFLGHPLKCLEAGASGTGFGTYLAILPGDALADIYKRYGSRILQKNLRNYLQATGKVNKGIQRTLKEQPERFLAYNNGLTITAARLDLNGSGQITRLHDFQIVNGGQTTASLDFARRFSGADLARVSVQAKIVVNAADDSGFIDDVSNFANSQNKVKISDFAARDAFNERLYRAIYLNDELRVESEAGGHTFWFFESFRGGYLTARNSLEGRHRRLFDVRFPRSQVFDKLELAKVENGWDGLPYFVCRGSDKNFNEWRRRTEPHRRSDPTMEECREIIAKVILFRRIASLVKEQGYAGFKSQIVAYAFSSLRFLLAEKDKEVRLDRLFSEQGTDDQLDNVLLDVISFVRKFLVGGAAGDEDPAQWAKKQLAWEAFLGFCRSRRSNPPAIHERLRRGQWLRAYSEHEDQMLRRVLSLLESKHPLTLGAVEIRESAALTSQQWTDARRELMELGRIQQFGSGRGARYGVTTGD